MKSFKEFLQEAHGNNVLKSWSAKPVTDIDAKALYSKIIKQCPEFPTMLQNGGILFRGWSASRTNASLAHGIHLVDTRKSVRRSRDTNNFYQMCFDHAPALKGIPSRSNSMIAATHRDAALQFGSMSIIIPFSRTPIAVYKQEDLFFHAPDKKISDSGFEDIGNFVDTYAPSAASYFTEKDIPRIKIALDKLTADKPGLSLHAETNMKRLFTQFKTNRFDNFCAKYLTPEKIGIKLYHAGDKLPMSDNVRKAEDAINRHRGNEVWFSGQAFSIDVDSWLELLDYCSTELRIKIHSNCKFQHHEL